MITISRNGGYYYQKWQVLIAIFAISETGD
jgi:hypothetical protein